jgi:hypothetical protein
MRTFFIKLPLSSILAICVLAMNAITLHAHNYEVEGTLNCKYFAPDGSKTEQNTKFVVTVDNTRWSIKTIFDVNWYSIHGCDGTNIYAIFYDPNPAGMGSKKIILPYLPGHITEGCYPLDVAYYTTMPWFAFASSDYLVSGTNSIPCFWRMPRSDPMAWIFENIIEQSKVPPYLPVRIKYITSTRSLKSATNNPALRLESLSKWEHASRDSDFQELGDGKVGGEYYVTAKTNINGFEIPIQFEGVTYLPSSLIKQSKASFAKQTIVNGDWTYTNLVFTGTVTKVSISNKISILPPLDKYVSVSDFRFRDSTSRVDCIQYIITNATWPSDKDPILLDAFNKKKNHISLPTIEKEHGGRAPVIFVLGLLTILPILLLAKKQLENTNKNNK